MTTTFCVTTRDLRTGSVCRSYYTMTNRSTYIVRYWYWLGRRIMRRRYERPDYKFTS
jgi:hypothetical protein